MPKLKILFEASPMIDNQKSGVGYYVEGLVKNLAAYHGDRLDLTGYFFNFLRRKHKPAPRITGVRFQVVTLIPGKLLSACRRFGFQPALELFTRKSSAIVLYTNYVALPSLRRRKKALIVYDLSFLDCPQYTQERNLAFLNRFAAPSIRQADLIVTISEFTKQRIEYYFPGLRSPIAVAPIPPVSIETQDVNLGERLSALGVTAGRYILHVGTIEPRKNIQGLIKAYAQLGQSTRNRYALILAGGSGWKNEATLQEIEDLQQQGLNIVVTGYVSDAEKAALYQHAACTVVASHYEGFGMPLLEAMQQRSPLAISDIEVFHEVAGNAALYFNRCDSGDIARVIAEILSDRQQREALVAKGTQRLQQFSWRNTADIVSDALVDITN